jgi:hypothetical protein
MTHSLDNIPRITLADEAWEQIGPEHDPALRLLACLTLNRVPFHVEAYAVGNNGGIQCCPDEWLTSQWQALCLLEPDEPFTEMTINGRQYVVVARPYAAT